MPKVQPKPAAAVQIEAQGRRAGDRNLSLEAKKKALASLLNEILQEGANITLTYDSGAGEITIATAGLSDTIDLTTATEIVVANGIITAAS